MINTTNRLRLAMAAAVFAPVLLAGCGGSDRVERTTTTERTTEVAPAPPQSSVDSTTTTTTRQHD
jgi:outer membrane murein-binding lipoprotein Lpp